MVDNNRQAFGIKGWLQGEFRVSMDSGRIDHFRAYREATASGQNNAGAPEEDYPIVFAIVEAYDQVAQARARRRCRERQ